MPEDAHGLEQPERPEGVGVGRVFGGLEADLHVALGGQVVDLIGLMLLDQTNEIGGVSQITIMHEEARITLVRVDVEIIDAGGVERGGAALDAVDGVALLQQQAREVCAILARNTGDERRLIGHANWLRATLYLCIPNSTWRIFQHMSKRRPSARRSTSRRAMKAAYAARACARYSNRLAADFIGHEVRQVRREDVDEGCTGDRPNAEGRSGRLTMPACARCSFASCKIYWRDCCTWASSSGSKRRPRVVRTPRASPRHRREAWRAHPSERVSRRR